LRFLALEVVVDFVEDEAVVAVVAFFEVGGVDLDLVWDLEKNFFEAGKDLDLLGLIGDLFV
jgi:hypothetical protein